MFTVIVCSLFNAVLLIALLTGIAVGVWRSRIAIGDALAFEPFDAVRPGATRSVSAHSA